MAALSDSIFDSMVASKPYGTFNFGAYAVICGTS
jgi:hypothetical protein